MYHGKHPGHNNISYKHQTINACWLYLRLIFLSEISNTKDIALITGSLTGDRTKLATNNFEWPNQSMPNISMWLMWFRILTRLYCAQSNSNMFHPSKRLGQWTTNHLQSNQQHIYLYYPKKKKYMSNRLRTMSNSSYLK